MTIEEEILKEDEAVERKRIKTNPPRMDFKEIEKFGITETSPEDMAMLMQVPLERLKRQLANPCSSTFRCYERGRALRRQSIKRKAYLVAIGTEEGNVPLLVRFLELEKEQEAKTNKQSDLTEKLIKTLTDAQKQEIVNMALGHLSDEDEEIINDE